MRRHCRRNDDFLCDIRELKYLETGGCECLDDRHRLVEKVRLEQLVRFIEYNSADLVAK